MPPETQEQKEAIERKEFEQWQNEKRYVEELADAVATLNRLIKEKPRGLSLSIRDGTQNLCCAPYSVTFARNF